MVTIRLAVAGDFEAVCGLLAELGRTAVDEANATRFQSVWDAQIDDASTSHLVAEVDDAVVGFCSLHIRDRLNRLHPEAWIPDLIVSSSVRRQGIGRALLEEAARRAREAGCHEMDLESGAQRLEAHRLYRSAKMAEGLAFVMRLVPGGNGRA